MNTTALVNALDRLTLDQIRDLHEEARVNEKLLQATAQRTNLKPDWDAARKAHSLTRLLANRIRQMNRVERSLVNLKRPLATVVG